MAALDESCSSPPASRTSSSHSWLQRGQHSMHDRPAVQRPHQACVRAAAAKQWAPRGGWARA
jgi:hypothetical protein